MPGGRHRFHLLEADRDGRIVGYDGWNQVRSRYASWIVREHFPELGSATQPVENGYHANAWVVLRHPDYDTLRGALDDIGRSVQVRAK